MLVQQTVTTELKDSKSLPKINLDSFSGQDTGGRSLGEFNAIQYNIYYLDILWWLMLDGAWKIGLERELLGFKEAEHLYGEPY